MEKVKIRYIESDDVKRVIELLVNAFNPRFEGEPNMENLSNPDSVSLVAEMDGIIVGFASLYVMRKLTRSLGLIEDVAVEEHVRKHGIGSMLVRKLIEISVEKGCDKVILNAAERNIPFYERNGFHQAERQMIVTQY